MFDLERHNRRLAEIFGSQVENRLNPSAPKSKNYSQQTDSRIPATIKDSIIKPGSHLRGGTYLVTDHGVFDISEGKMGGRRAYRQTTDAYPSPKGKTNR